MHGFIPFISIPFVLFQYPSRQVAFHPDLTSVRGVRRGRLILKVDGVSKSFGSLEAVKNVSLAIPEGKICGLLGPNGAGKTTLIRMIMDIYQPDRGTIEMGVASKDRKNHIGYLPEERGLYSKVKVRDALVYFAMLKGLSKPEALLKVAHYLELLKMEATAGTEVRKLSKGNQQKIQIISSMVADPELLILDEPFSGLDPLNTKMVSQCMEMLRDRGVTILLSTHQMNQAESFCDEIFLFNKGELILSGHLRDIIAQNSGQFWVIESEGEIPPPDWFEIIEVAGRKTKVRLESGRQFRDLLQWLGQQPFDVEAIQPFRLPLSEIFIKEVNQHG